MSRIISEIDLTKRFLKNRLQRDFVTFRGHASKWQNIYELMKRSAELSESNSLLLIGPRGSGKTTLINSVLYTLLQDVKFEKNALIVYLNGLIHTDDKLALKAATLQLNLENAVDGKVFGSFADNLSFLLSCVRSGNKSSKSVIFILEEFDLFCSHHNQTLLYNLFDISQSAQAPICVLGITCRLDVIELLEKRVKSRYSHRQIFLYPDSNNFNERLELFGELLKLPEKKEIAKSKELKTNLENLRKTLDFCFLRNIFDASAYEFTKNHVNSWNQHIDKLITNATVQKCLQGMYDLDTNEDYFKKFLYRLVSILKESHVMLTEEDVRSLYVWYQPKADDKVNLLSGLSVLELCLVIAMKHYSEIYDCDPFNFEIIFARFSKFTKASTTMQGIERGVVLKAYEHLKNLEFILPLSSIGAGKIQKEFRMHRMALTSLQINQAITNYHALPTEVSQWSQSELF